MSKKKQTRAVRDALHRQEIQELKKKARQNQSLNVVPAEKHGLADQYRKLVGPVAEQED